MSDSDDEFDVPTRIVSHFYDNLADAVESLEAAERLGLGVTVRNRVVVQGSAEDGDEVLLEEWVVDVYDAPAHGGRGRGRRGPRRARGRARRGVIPRG